jgi:uncharacterized protein (TIGR03382 family)
LCLVLAADGFAQDGYEAPYIETGLGATNVQATIGNGGLTAGISRDGDLTILSWPSPSYYDQLHYITTNALDAREQPRFGAPERAGAFAGLMLTPSGGGDATLTYLREWDTEVTFAQDHSRVLETTFTNSNLGLTVTQHDMIPQDRDVLIRRYTVDGDLSGWSDVQLVSYANLSPGLSKIPQVPLLDVLMDHQNDFIAIWNQAEDAIVQFHPDDTGIISNLQEALNATSSPVGRDFGPIGEELKESMPDGSTLDDLAQDLDSDYSSGVYVTMSSSPSPAAHQIGEDATDTCSALGEIADNITDLAQMYPDRDLPADPTIASQVKCGDYDPVDDVRAENDWSYQAEDAFTDLKDGSLNGSDVAAGQANTAWTVSLKESGTIQSRQGAVYFAFGDQASSSAQTLSWARNQSLDQLKADLDQSGDAYVQSLEIPASIDGDLRAFIERAFLNMQVGTDRESGAIVASVSRQPSYQLDWPRDGAFFNVALDLAGEHELVTKRMKFYADTIRDEPVPVVPLLNNYLPGYPPGYPDDLAPSQIPPDSWEMNYYADGMPGGNIRLEIDNTALLVWSFVAHAAHLTGSDRESYLNDMWPVIERATNFIHDWRDPETGLMWFANEDDHIEYTQGLQGAITSYLALVSAARVAKARGETELAEKWAYRAGELRNATVHYMYKGEEEGWIDYGEEGGAAGKTWMAWPARFLPFDDPRLREVTEAGLQNNLEEVKGNSGNGNYPTKAATSAALVFDDQRREDALEIARRLAEDIANQDTWTIGESIVPVDSNDDGETDDFINGVSTPHLWSAILVYVSAMAYHQPQKFDQYREVFPAVEIPDVTPPGVEPDGDTGMADAGDGDAGSTDDAQSGDDGGCGCASTSSSVPTMPAMLLVGVLVGWRRHRRE